ncbi:MAG: hypothetical protein HC846_08040 [Blastocatellia bacterium]|nr:hypothetical protein [Blastocatellia bacterium]
MRDAGNFFFPSPTANLVGYGEGGHRKFCRFWRDPRVALRPCIFQHFLSSQRESSASIEWSGTFVV